MIRKLVVVLLTGVMCLVGITSAALTSMAQDKVDISMLIIGYHMEDWVDPLTGKTNLGVERLEKKFNEMNPHVNLKVISIPWGSKLGPYAKALAGLRSGEFDIAQMPAHYVTLGLLEPLDQYIAKDKIDVKEFFYANYLQPLQLQIAGDEQSKQYAIPLHIDLRMIGFDKRIFDKYGVSYLSENPTMKEIMDKAKRLSGIDSSGKETYGIWIKGARPEWYFLEYIRHLGGEFDLGGVPNFTSKEAIEALKWMVDVAEFSPRSSLNSSEMNPPGFATEKNNVAISAHVSPEFALRVAALGVEEHFGIRVNVRAPDGFGGEMGQGPIGINIQCEHKEAAWEALKFFVSKETARFMLKNTNQWISSTKGWENWDMAEDIPYRNTLAKGFSLADPRVGNYGDVIRVGRYIIRSEVQSALTRQITSEQACERMQDNITQKMKEE